MTHGSLFSGIGGFDLAAEWAGWTNVFHCEYNPFCQKVLKHYWPDADSYGDIHEFDGSKYYGTVDIISGGFPCQPFSVAGKRKGEADNRFIWGEMLRVITEIKPRWVVGENVAGIVTMENGRTLAKILTSLEDSGYKTEQYIIPACAVGAWHRRDRIWIIAHTKSIGCGRITGEKCGDEQRKFQSEEYEGCEDKRCGGIRITTDSEGIGIQGQRIGRQQVSNTHEKQELFMRSSKGRIHAGWKTESSVDRMVHGIPNRMDRIKGLGNSIVPQVAYQIFKAINEYELTKNIDNDKH